MSEDQNVNNVVVVNDIKQLPYAYIPYHSVEHARTSLRKRREAGNLGINPDATLYHFVSLIKAGWQIIAYPVVMTKPKEEADGQA